MLKFIHTKNLMGEIDEALKNTTIQEDSSLINYYLVKIAIILFSSELENHLKELISKKIAGYKHFCRLCNKLRNPKYTDINSALKDLQLTTLSIAEEKISKYSNIILARNKIAHQPDYNHQLTIKDISECIEIGEEIINNIEQQVE